MKEKYKNTLIGLGMIVVVVILISIVGKMDKNAIKNCTSAGNSLSYCQSIVDGE